jgi:hypothetical protein
MFDLFQTNTLILIDYFVDMKIKNQLQLSH